jgi:LCP family protein required for cell wall assembly
MFEHLDDPEPYVPGPGLEQAVVQRGRSLKRRRRLVAGGAVTAVLLLAGVAGAAAVVDQKLDDVERVDVAGLGEDVGRTDPQTVLFVGTDSDAGLDGADPARTEPFRADTVILARVDPGRNVLAILPLPRDLLVDLPDGRQGRLNAAFADGGPEQLVEVIRQNLGVVIDRYVQTDLAGAVAIGDALGGLPLEFSTPVRDRSTGLDAGTGCTTYSGEELLQIGRSRHVEYLEHGTWTPERTSDLGRIERQQAIGAALIERLSELDASDPSELTRLLSAAAEHLWIDDGTTNAELVDLVRSVAGSQVQSFRLPVEPAEVEGTIAVLEAQEPAASETIDAFLRAVPPGPEYRGPSLHQYGAVAGSPVPCGEGS